MTAGSALVAEAHAVKLTGGLLTKVLYGEGILLPLIGQVLSAQAVRIPSFLQCGFEMRTGRVWEFLGKSH